MRADDLRKRGRRKSAVSMLVTLMVLAGCGGGGSSQSAQEGDPPTATPSPSPTPSDPGDAYHPVALAFSFANDLGRWEAGFSDYASGTESEIGFVAERRQLPEPLSNEHGFLLSGRNVSDDLFMYITQPVQGFVLRPNRRYRVELSVTFATNVPRGCVDVGGAPGEAVTLKLGASTAKPANVVLRGSFLTTNFDKGNQSTGGADVVAVGDFAQEEAGDCTKGAYQKKTVLTKGNGPIVSTDANGQLWIVVGTDSGFEGRTDIYYMEGTATFTPV